MFKRLLIYAVVLSALLVAACAPPPEMIATLTMFPITPTRAGPTRAATSTFYPTSTFPPVANELITITPGAPDGRNGTNTETPPPSQLPFLNEETGQILMGNRLVFDVQRDAPGCQAAGMLFSPTYEHFLVVPDCPQGMNPGYIFSIDGEDRRLITAKTDLIHNRDFDWSPDGTQIVYLRTSEQGVNKGLIIYDLASGKRDLILEIKNQPDSGLPTQPRWSPDGQWIAFLLVKDGNSAEVNLIQPDGSEQLVLDSFSDYEPNNPLEWQQSGSGELLLVYRAPEGEIIRTYPLSSAP